MLIFLFQSVLPGEVEVVLSDLILSELLSVWSEVTEVFALGEEVREDVELSARETDLHISQLLVRLRMLHMLFEDSKCAYNGLCQCMGGVAVFPGADFFRCIFICVLNRRVLRAWSVVFCICVLF